MSRKAVIDISGYLVAFLFIYAAVSKLMDIDQFHLQVSQSPMLARFSWFVVWFIPLAELTVAVMLVTDRFRLAGFYCAFSLMIMFTAYIVMIVQFSDDIPCSCGGVLQSLGWGEHLVFNIIFIVLVGTGTYLEVKRSAKVNLKSYV